MYEQVRLDEEPNSVVTLTRREVMDLLDRYDLEPRRALGQNFVVDPNTVRRIAALSRVGEHDRVVEIGPGLGSLTLALCETGAGVVAIEADRSILHPAENPMRSPSAGACPKATWCHLVRPA